MKGKVREEAQVFAKTAGYLSTSPFAFLEKWMRDVKISQDSGGAFPASAPRARFGNTVGDLSSGQYQFIS